MIAKYKREKSLVSKRWNKGQLEAVKEVFGTVDKIIIDRFIIEEVKQVKSRTMIKCTTFGCCVREWMEILKEVI